MFIFKFIFMRRFGELYWGGDPRPFDKWARGEWIPHELFTDSSSISCENDRTLSY